MYSESKVRFHQNKKKNRIGYFLFFIIFSHQKKKKSPFIDEDGSLWKCKRR